MEKIEVEPDIFHKLTSRFHEVYFSQCVPYLVSHEDFFFFISRAIEDGKLL